VLLVSYFFVQCTSVSAQCTADAGANITICAGETIVIGGSPTATGGGGGLTYTWSPATALSSTSMANPNANPTATITYTVTLNGGGCAGVTDQITVTVLPSPDANFTFGPNNACGGTQVNFVNSTTACPSCDYVWDFNNPDSGSSNTSTTGSPSHNFVAPGGTTSTFNVSLTATAANGCSNTQLTNVNVLQSPVAILIDDANFTQCLGLNSFYAYVTNQSTPGNITNYNIDWGDGTADYNSSAPPSSYEHIYNGIDIWTLTYTVTGPNNCTDVETYTVTNISNPALGANTSGNTLQCGPVELCFDISGYTNNFSEITYDVNFGDNSPIENYTQANLPNPVCHDYTASSCPGSYTFIITAVSNCPNPTQATISPIVIYSPPSAAFTNPASYCVNSPAPFTNTSIPGYNQACSNNTTYSWNFGDPGSGANNTSTTASPSHSYSAPGTYTVTLSASNGGNPQLSCGTTTYTNTICIEPAPVPIFTVNDNDGCVPMAVTTDNTSTSLNSCGTSTAWLVDYTDLPCDPDNGSYSYTGATSSTSLEPQFLLSSVGTYNLRLRMTNSCGVFEDVETVVVNTVPVVQIITPPSGICAGTSGTFSSTVDPCNLPITNTQWTFTGGTPASFTGATPPAISYAAQGNFNVTLQVTNACGPSTANGSVGVLAIPNVLVTASEIDNTICNGQAATLTASGAGTYTWSPSTYLSSTNGTSVTVTPTGPITYTVTGTAGSCTDTGTITLGIDPLPTVLAGGTFAYCQNLSTPLSLNVSGGSGTYLTYEWSPSTGLNNQNIQNPVASSISSQNYTVSVTDNEGCIGTGTVPVTVNPLPNTNAGLDLILCNQPVPTQITGFSPTTGGTGPGGSGTWSGPNVTTLGVFTPSGVQNGTLTYCFTNSVTNCTKCDDINVTVNAPTIANAGPDSTVCLSSTNIQLPTPVGGVWSGSPYVTAAGVYDPTIVGPDDVILTVGTGSCADTDTMIVFTLGNPTANAGPDLTVCAGDTVNFNGTGNSTNGGITQCIWSGWLIPANAVVSQFSHITLSTPISNTTYSLAVIDGAGCTGNDTRTVFVNPLPVVSAGLDQTVCDQPVATALVGSPLGGTWTGTGVVGNQYTPTGIGATTDILTYSYTNPLTGCKNTDQVNMNVIVPTQANVGANVQVCLNEPAFNLNPVTPGGTWSAITAGAPITSGGVFTPSSGGPFQLLYTIGSGTCLTKDTLLVTVYSLPNLNAGNDIIICAGQCTTVNTTVTGGQANYTFDWNFESTLNNDGLEDPTSCPAFTTTYSIIVTDAHGCQDSDQVTVTVNGLPVVEAGPNITVCDQAIAEVLTGFSPTIGGTGTWTGLGISDSNGEFTSPGIGTYWIYYEFEAGGNSCADMDSLQVTVIAPTFANAGNDVTVCLNDPNYELTGFSPAVGGTWSGDGIINASGGVVSPVGAGVGVSILTYEFGTGTCYTTDEIDFEVIALPVVNAGNDIVVCGNAAAFVMTGYTPANGGTWEGTGITNSSTGAFDPSVGTDIYDVFLWYEDPLTGCSDTSYMTVNVSPVPVANFSVATLGCTNASLDVTNSSIGASIYAWNFGNGDTSGSMQPNYTYPDQDVFDVTLIASNAFGCSDTAMNSTEIINPPLSALSLSPHEGCAPLNVEFDNQSVGLYTTFFWDLDVLSTSDSIPDAIQYQQGPDTVVYNISLTVTNFCGSDIDEDEVVVIPQPVAGFGTNMDVFCSPFPVIFNNTSVGLPETFEWDFGDGTFSNVEEPGTHYFYADSMAVDYTITLMLSNQCGQDTIDYTITVLPNTVTSFFNTNITIGCEPLEVEFTDYSEGGTQISYDLGDSNSTSDDNPVHIYNEGEYTIYQYVDNGCSYDTSEISIVVFGTPAIDFTTDVENICTNNLVHFIPELDDAIEVFWDFDNGDFSQLASPTYEFTEGGTFNVTMTALNDNECEATVVHPFTVFEGPLASFTIPNNIGCSPYNLCVTNSTTDGLFYSWDFGDGNTANTLNACNQYVNIGTQPILRTITLIAQDFQLCADTMQMNVIISPQPAGAFTLSGYESCTFPVNVQATNLSVGANGYDWQVNGVSVSDVLNPSFAFESVGDYQINLNSSNQFGCNSLTSVTYHIYPKPSSDFVADTVAGCVDLLVNFTNNSLGSQSYYWSFGDGGVSQANAPQHLYNVAGIYDVSLIATSANGCKDTLTAPGLVNAFEVPQAYFYFTPEETSVYEPTVTFTDGSTAASQWQWTFGDGSVAYTPYITHYYEDGGVYPVELTVWSEYGCTNKHSETVIINDLFEVYVPNTFTPDNDGLNDLFLPQLSGKGFIEAYLFEVFDRWGTVIFRTTDMEQPWTGNVREGSYYAQDDAYNWQIKINFKAEGIDDQVFQGHVLMIR
jgi:large repetitive protein